MRYYLRYIQSISYFGSQKSLCPADGKYPGIIIVSGRDRINCHSIRRTIDGKTNAAKGAEPINLYENCVSTHGSEIRSCTTRMRMRTQLKRSGAKYQRETRTTTWGRGLYGYMASSNVISVIRRRRDLDWRMRLNEMQAAAHEFNYQAQGASELLPSRSFPRPHGHHYPPPHLMAGRRVRVVVTPGCNVNQLHYHKLLLAYVSVPSQERAGCAEQTLLHSLSSKVEGKQRNSEATFGGFVVVRNNWCYDFHRLNFNYEFPLVLSSAFSQWRKCCGSTHTHTQTLGPMHLSRLSRRQPSKQHQMMQLLRHADGKGTGKDIKQDGLGQKSRGDSLAPIFAILGRTKSKSSAANVIKKPLSAKQTTLRRRRGVDLMPQPKESIMATYSLK